MFLVGPQMFKSNMYLSSSYLKADFFWFRNDFKKYIASMLSRFYT